jgi:glycosyltransferase involved in cell wall biosynthesis
VLLQALQKIKQQGLSFRAFIIGGGPLQSELEKLQTDLGLSNCVVLLSQMSQTELLAYYCQAEVFALACEVQNDGDRDGIPNVLVEAMAMGIPVVSTSISGIPELVDNGVNGLLMAEKDPSGLAEAIATLLRQPELAQRLGRAGRAKVEREFDSKRNVKKIGELLQRALDRQTRTEPAFRGTKSSKSSKLSRTVRRSAAVASVVDA